MSAISLVPLRFLRFFARWQEIVATQDGLLISTFKHRTSLDWQQIDEPPRLDGFMPWNTVKVVSSNHSHFFSLLGRSAPEFVKHCQEQWAKHHGARLCLFAQKVEQLLKQRYLCQALLSEIQTHSRTLLAPWQEWYADELLSPEVFKALATLQEVVNWSENDVEEFKRAFEQHQLAEHKHFFDTIESSALTLNQRLACIKQEKNQLLLAAAGSGKTSVMVARAGYLIKANYTQANQILLLAYGNEAATEMQQRLTKRDITQAIRAQTFHSLGMQIITKVEGKQPDISLLATDSKTLHEFTFNTLRTLSQEPNFESALLKFISRNAYFFSEHRSVSTKTAAELFSLPMAKRLAKTFSELLIALKEFGLTESVEKLKIAHQADLDLLMPLFSEYQMELKEQGKIDFTDMIARATRYVEKGQFVPNWTHILVDEFQDISRSRVKLLRALQTQCKNSSLFAVGDDWQAIYRFSGADVSLTTHFSEYFAPALISVLDTTFRFHQNLVDVSSQFITKNPLQCTKSLKAFRAEPHPAFTTVKYDGESIDGYANVLQILQTLGQQNNGKPVNVLIMARFSRDLPPAHMLKQWQERFDGIACKAMTVHAAKGKEADYAIVLGLRDGASGFPCKRATLPILEALLPNQEAYPFAEERRLFYVALTRAKRHVYLLCSKTHPSEFVDELS